MSDKPLYVRAYAKVNLFLDVTDRLDNGYHLVNLVMQSIALHDGLYFSLSNGQNDTLTIVDAEGKGRFADLGTDDSNLVIRAVRSLREQYPERFPEKSGLDIRLEKRIPSQAGLAGGSADAAATLIGGNNIFSLGLTEKELEETALTLGADVPFCVRCGTVRAEGIGEILSPLSPLPDCFLVIAKPAGCASTRDIYNAIDNEDIDHPDFNRMANALDSGNIASVADALANIMEPVTARTVPEVSIIVRDLMKHDALGARMTGSGSAVFGIFDDRETAERAAAAIRTAGHANSVYVTEPINTDQARTLRFKRKQIWPVKGANTFAI